LRDEEEGIRGKLTQVHRSGGQEEKGNGNRRQRDYDDKIVKMDRPFRVRGSDD
jgi:hypothetical protein